MNLCERLRKTAPFPQGGEDLMKISGIRQRVLPIAAGGGGRPAARALGSSDSMLLDAVASALFCDDTAEPNLVVLSGEVGEPPLPIQGRAAEPALHLTLDHRLPVTATAQRLATTSVEVPSGLLNAYPGNIEMGDAVLVLGKAAGDGAVLATALAPARPRGATSAREDEQ